MLENKNINEPQNPAFLVGAVSGSFMCALGKENPCKKQCFTCSEDEKCDNKTLSNQDKGQNQGQCVLYEDLSDKCPMCKSDNLFDVDDNWTKCCDCGFSFVG
jgi:hypothetical protein